MCTGMGRGLSTSVIVGVLAAVVWSPVSPASAQGGLTLTPNPVDFGVVAIDSVVRRSVTLTNTSNAPITVSGFVMSSDLVNLDPAGSTCERGMPLPAGGQCGIALFTFPDGPGSFQGVTLTVYTSDGQVAATAGVTGTVADRPSRPNRPTKASRELLPRGGSRITWEKVPGATSYEVQSSGRVVCRVAAPRLSCRSDKAFGPRVGLWITAANEAGVSGPTRVQLRAPKHPVTFATVAFKGRSGALNKQGRKAATAAGIGLRKQGFYRDITVVAGTKPGRSIAAARAEAVRAVVLEQFASRGVDDADVRTSTRGAGNAVTITVQ